MARIRYQEAAGLEVKRGRASSGLAPTKDQLIKLYVKENRSIRDVAEVLGCSKDMVYRSLKEYEIELRPKIRRSQLRAYELNYLRREIDSKGYKKVAAELEVGITTLRDYIKANQ